MILTDNLAIKEFIVFEKTLYVLLEATEKHCNNEKDLRYNNLVIKIQ